LAGQLKEIDKDERMSILLLERDYCEKNDPDMEGLNRIRNGLS
jgi:hypothetical protein